MRSRRAGPLATVTIAAAALVATALPVLGDPAAAAAPENGPIVWGDGSELHSTELTSGASTEIGADAFVSYSPDGSRVAYDRDGRLFVRDLASGSTTALTSGSGASRPDWSPDGRALAFQRAADGVTRVSVIDVDTGAVRPVSGGTRDLEPAWSPDGSAIAFRRAYGEHDSVASELWVVNLATGIERRLTQTSTYHAAFAPSWSPDGVRLVLNVWTCEFCDGPTLVVVDLDGRVTYIGTAGHTPAWSPDGTTIAVTTEAASDRAPAIRLLRPDGTIAREIDLGMPLGTAATVRDWPPSGTDTAATRLDAPTTTTRPPSQAGGTTGGAVGVEPTGSGYWLLESDGDVHGFGDARHHGDAASGSARHIEPTATGNGYWIVDDRGRVSAHGDARSFGSAPLLRQDETIVALVRTATGEGYWLVSSVGRVFPFGDAETLGGLGDHPLNAPVVGASATPSGKGYYLVASDGGVFTYGDARFLGSTGAHPLNAPVRSFVADPDGAGYWLVASDGGVFAFSAPFRGSLGATTLNAPVTGMIAYGDGYLLAAADGGVFTFSNRAFLGSLGSTPPDSFVMAIAAAS